MHNSIYWRGVLRLIQYNAPLDPDFLLSALNHIGSRESSLPAVLGFAFNRDGTVSDPIAFHAERMLTQAAKEQDQDAFKSAFIAILRRHEKLNRIQSDKLDKPTASWLTGKR